MYGSLINSIQTFKNLYGGRKFAHFFIHFTFIFLLSTKIFFN
jgi:hypothetical protein